MSLSSAGSFSVRINMPVAWGAKTCKVPFCIPALSTASCAWPERSMKSISPWVWKLMVEFATLKLGKVSPFLYWRVC